MPNAEVYTRSFAGGVVSPSLFGRIDDAKRDVGLKTAINMLIEPQGPATTRPGTKFVRAAKNALKYARMLPFRFSSTQTMAIEAGEAYFRFHTFGQTLLTPASGVPAWDSVSVYEQGDLVTFGGDTWYAAEDVPANKQPDLFEYGANTPVVSSTWVLSYGPSQTPPPGTYEFVGSELPAAVTPSAQVYISVTTYETVFVETPIDNVGPDSGGSILLPSVVAVTTYTGYTGQTVTTTANYWYRMGEEYEIPSPYAEIDLRDLHYTQSADVMTITHPKYAPRELRRLGATRWVLTLIPFGSQLAAPTGGGATPTTIGSPSTTQTYSYVCTRVSDDQKDESVAGPEYTCVNQLYDTGAINTIATGTTDRCNVYRLQGGLYGFIGQTTTGTLIDDNIAPDVSRTPPLNQTPFTTDWPAAVGYFEQRRGFAGTPLLPQSVWLTKSATESNLDYSIPPRDNDAVSFKMAAREASSIRHLVPLADLILLTDSGEWRLKAINSDAVTPTSFSLREPSHVGASNVQPVVVDTDLVYAAARGGHLRALGFSSQSDGYVSVDLSLRCPHYFDFKRIADLAFARAPTPTIWIVSNDGRLMSLTYVPSQEVFAFAEHASVKGAFESICVVTEGDEDILYASVLRFSPDNSSAIRVIERLSERFYVGVSNAYFVDCGLTYNGAAANVISGLDHLEGQTVAILADGAVQPLQVVDGGEITLPNDIEASVVHVGFPLVTHTELPPMALETPGYAQAVTKNVNRVTLRVQDSGRFFAGPNINTLREAAIRTTEPYGSPPALRTGVIDIDIDGDWNDDGCVSIVTTDPLPLTILSLTAEVSLGG